MKRPAGRQPAALAPHTGRTTHRFRRLAANLRAQRRPCCICHQPIDYTLSKPDPGSFSVEHKKPRSTHPHLAEDPGNLDAAHLGCNSSKQAADQPGLGDTSTGW